MRALVRPSIPPSSLISQHVYASAYFHCSDSAEVRDELVRMVLGGESPYSAATEVSHVHILLSAGHM